MKETDRLAAMATELRKVGAKVDEGEDYIHVVPPAKLQFAEIGTYNDHRMAMCFAGGAVGYSGHHSRSEMHRENLPGLFRTAGAHQPAGVTRQIVYFRPLCGPLSF